MAIALLSKSATDKPLLWTLAAIVSLALLALVIMQVDASQFYAMFENLSWIAIAAAFLFLLLEGIATALRLWLFAGKKPCLSEALKANAWYVLLLVALPARLGEVAAIVVLERYLGQKYGAAAMSIITQRLYDVIVLSVIFLIALLGLGDFIDIRIMSIATLALMSFALVVLVRLNMFLTLGVVCMGKSQNRVIRKLRWLALQARMYTRHGMSRRDIPLALLLTLLKWLSNLSALICMLTAIHLGLGPFEKVTIAAAYNFLAIIPLQTIGGIGVNDAGLMLLLAGMGLPSSVAAGASLMIRFVVVIFPIIFWLMVIGGLKLKDRLGL